MKLSRKEINILIEALEIANAAVDRVRIDPFKDLPYEHRSRLLTEIYLLKTKAKAHLRGE